MTGDEQKALAFVGVLLCLAGLARFMNRPDAVVIDASGIDLQEYRKAGQALAAAEASDTPPRKRHAPLRQKRPQPDTNSHVPRWRRPDSPPAFDADKPPAARTRSGPLDLNRATAEELETLPGIGAVTARRIVALRDSIGRFERVEELDRVRGIGKALIEKVRDRVVVR